MPLVLEIQLLATYASKLESTQRKYIWFLLSFFQSLTT